MTTVVSRRWRSVSWVASVSALACSTTPPGGLADGAGSSGDTSGPPTGSGSMVTAGSLDTGGTATAGAPTSGASSSPTSTGTPTSTGGEPNDTGSVDAPRELLDPNGFARNPIVSHVFTADPSADVFEDRVYVYTTHDPDDQDGYDMVDYHVFSSRDLVNWQDHGVIFDSADVPWAANFYAPDCIYNETLGQYFLYFPDSGSAVGVAVADRPEGPFEDALGQPLVTRTTPGVEDVEWVFDPTAFIDDDGQAYLYFGGGPDDTGDNARVIRLNPDMVSLQDTSATTIVAPEFFEASFMHERDGLYFFSYSTGFDQGPAEIDFLVSDDPMVGFEYQGTVLPSPAGNNGDNNHHSILEIEGQWYIFYHNRVLSNLRGFSNFQRSITLDRVTFDAEGNMNPVSAQMGQVAQLRAVDAFERIEGETMAAEEGVETDFLEGTDNAAGVRLTSAGDQDWIGVSQIDFGDGATAFVARVASGAPDGGTLEVLVDGCPGFTEAGGTVAGACAVPNTGGWDAWTEIECEVAIGPGLHDLCLRFRGTGDRLVDVDHYTFR